MTSMQGSREAREQGSRGAGEQESRGAGEINVLSKHLCKGIDLKIHRHL